MQAYLTLVRRELGGYLLSLRGYVLMAAVLFLQGVSFVILLPALRQTPSDVPITELFYRTYVFWLILLLTVPVITMRLFALEKYSGTFETLMTTPVSDTQVVLAKFSSALLFYLLTWLPLLACVLVLRQYTDDPTAFDPQLTAVTFLGILLLGCLYVALGCFASAMTSSQIIAAMVSFALGITLFLLGFLALNPAAHSGWRAQLFSHISVLEHMGEFSRGIIDSRRLMFYLGLTVFFLFLTVRVVESRRWK